MRYFAYMLRLWLSAHSNADRWRASLEDVHTHERLVFVELEELIAFLRNLDEKSVEADPPLSSATVEEDVP